MTEALTVADIERCFTGVVPAVIATASADGVPNVTYLSRVHAVDAERVALSNQFFSKTVANLAENRRASLLVIDPATYDQFRLDLEFERTERRGPLFDHLEAEVESIAALTGMHDVFRLRAADVYRVVRLTQVPPNPDAPRPDLGPPPVPRTAAVGEICTRMARCSDLEQLVTTVVDELEAVLGYHHVHLMLVDETKRSLYAIASKGFAADSIGSEIEVGEGLIGLAAQRRRAMRVGNAGQMAKYARSIERSSAGQDPKRRREVTMPRLAGVKSRIAVPAIAFDELVGVLMAESTEPIAFGAEDEAALTVVANLFASQYETLRVEERCEDEVAEDADVGGPEPLAEAGEVTRIRFYETDGSTFLDGDYLIKGVAGRILWRLLAEHDRDGRVDFTNRELRLDPSLQMPGFKDNLESRLILLKRRLDEREAPIHLTRTGRGRFRLEVDQQVRLEQGD